MISNGIGATKIARRSAAMISNGIGATKIARRSAAMISNGIGATKIARRSAAMVAIGIGTAKIARGTEAMAPIGSMENATARIRRRSSICRRSSATTPRARNVEAIAIAMTITMAVAEGITY
jgi:hypothetical protein